MAKLLTAAQGGSPPLPNPTSSHRLSGFESEMSKSRADMSRWLHHWSSYIQHTPKIRSPEHDGLINLYLSPHSGVIKTQREQQRQWGKLVGLLRRCYSVFADEVRERGGTKGDSRRDGLRIWEYIRGMERAMETDR